MKFQKYKWTYLIVGTFSFCLCLAFIYQQFHHDSGHKIENITIKPKKVVKTPSIDFKINSIDVRKSATSVDTQVKMHIDRKNLSQLNMVDQNFNLANNMFLNIPFEDSSPSDLVTTESGKNVTYQDLKKPQLNLVVHFYADRNAFELNDKKPEFIFMIPGKTTLTKYSMPIT